MAMTVMETYVDILEIVQQQEQVIGRRKAELGMQKHLAG